MFLNIYKPISTLGGLGYQTPAPGTIASLIGVGTAWPIHVYGPPYSLAAAAFVAFCIGCWAAEKYQKSTARTDAPEIIIDELSGQWLSLAFLPPDLLYFGFGFLLFRLYDIIKPWPINLVDKGVKGGLGVMADDILAALYVYLTFGIFLIW